MQSCLQADGSGTRVTSGHTLGQVVQVLLGIAIGFSSVQIEKGLPIDELVPLLVLSAFLIVVSSSRSVPRPHFFFGRLTWVIGIGALLWYIIYALISWQRTNSTIFYSASPFVQIAACSIIALPIAVTAAFLVSRRHSEGVALPLWGMALLALALTGIAADAQFGYIPIYLLGLLLGFYAGFLVGNLRSFFISAITVSFGFIAILMSRFLSLGYTEFVRNSSVALYETMYLRLNEGFTIGSRWKLFAVHPNLTGAYLILIISVCAAILCYTKGKARQRVKYVLGFFVLALLMTKSRGALLGLVTTVVAYAAMQRLSLSSRKQRVCAVFGLAAFIAIIGCISTVRSFTERGRLDMVDFAIQAFFQHPVLGNGVDSFGHLWMRHTWDHPGLGPGAGNSHNMVAQIMCDMGLIGLVSVCVLGYCVVKQMRGLRKQLLSNADLRAFDWTSAGIIGFLVTGLFNPTWFYPPMKLLIPVLVGAWWGVVTHHGTPMVSCNRVPVGPRARSAFTMLLLPLLACYVATRMLPSGSMNLLGVITADYIDNIRPLRWADFNRGALCCRVVDEGETPIADAKLTLDIGTRTSTCRSGVDGECLFSGLEPGPCSLRAQCDGFNSRETTVNIQDKCITHQLLQLKRSDNDVTSQISQCTMSGRVLDKMSGRPIPKAFVVIEPECTRVLTGPSGGYRMSVNGTSVRRVVAGAPGYVSHSSLISCNQRRPIDLDFRLYPKRRDMLKNGDFAEGPVGRLVTYHWAAWQPSYWSNGLLFDVVTSGGREVRKVQRFYRKDNLRVHGGIVQVAPTKAGGCYVLQAEVWFTSADGAAWCEVGYDLSGQTSNGEAKSIQYTKLEKHGQGKWIWFEKPIIASGNRTSVFIKCGHYDETGTGIFECRVGQVHLLERYAVTD